MAADSAMASKAALKSAVKQAVEQAVVKLGAVPPSGAQETRQKEELSGRLPPISNSAFPAAAGFASVGPAPMQPIEIALFGAVFASGRRPDLVTLLWLFARARAAAGAADAARRGAVPRGAAGPARPASPPASANTTPALQFCPHDARELIPASRPGGPRRGAAA